MPCRTETSHDLMRLEPRHSAYGENQRWRVVDGQKALHYIAASRKTCRRDVVVEGVTTDLSLNREGKRREPIGSATGAGRHAPGSAAVPEPGKCGCRRFYLLSSKHTRARRELGCQYNRSPTLLLLPSTHPLSPTATSPSSDTTPLLIRARTRRGRLLHVRTDGSWSVAVLHRANCAPQLHGEAVNLALPPTHFSPANLHISPC